MAILSNVFLRAGVPYRVGPSPNDLRTFSADELRAYVSNTRRMLKAGLSVPVLSEHAPPGAPEGGPVLLSEGEEPPAQFADALKTAGWVEDVRFNPKTGEAVAFYDITSKPYLSAIQEGSIRFTSPELRESYVDGLARPWHNERGGIFAHFALTAKPRNPEQSRLAEVAQGQFAMQFGMEDAVGFKPQRVNALQFGTNPYDLSGKIGRTAKPSMRRKPRSMGMRNLNTNADLAEEKGPDSQESIAGASPTRPLGQQKVSGARPAGRQPNAGYSNAAVKTPTNKDYSGGVRRRPAGTNRKPLGVQGFDDQFDYSLQDAGMGFPGPVPADSLQGPFGSGNAGLDAALEQTLTPPENPDVIKAPDEAKRQQSEAILQLLGELGLPLPVGCDFTPLDDGTLNALLAAAKTLIAAENRYEEDAASQQQDQVLKEQVPMANQMSEDEAYGVIGRALREVVQLDPDYDDDDSDDDDDDHRRIRNRARSTDSGSTPGTSIHSRPPDERVGRRRKKRRWYRVQLSDDPVQFGKRGKSKKAKPEPDTESHVQHENKETRAHENDATGRVSRRTRFRQNPKKKATRYTEGFNKSRSTCMSEDTDRRVKRQVAAQKARLDQNTRHGLGQYIYNCPLPPGVKQKLLAKVPSVQFSLEGHALPTFTMNEVVRLLIEGTPRQFQEDELTEQTHPQDKTIARGRDANSANIAQGMGDKTPSRNGTGQWSEEETQEYYDRKFRQPGWDRMATNGHAV